MRLAIIILLFGLLLFGCTGNHSNTPTTSGQNDNVVGTWRAYSEYIGYAGGGSNILDHPGTESLQINAGGTWSYGSSSGTWSVSDIAESDWTKWGISSYGPTKKITLNGWNNDVGDGPIESESTTVNFIWVIYNAKPPVVSRDAQIQIKFGH